MDNNKLIAEFMGYIYEDDILVPEEPQYHTSWDWLIPVIEKIEQVNEGVPQQMLHVNLYSEIGEVYTAVVEFIKENESNFLCGSCGERCSEYTYSEDRDIDECNECKSSNDER